VVLGFELRASYWLGRWSTAWAMAPSPFALAVFQAGSHVFAQAGLDCNPLTYCLRCSWDHRHTPPCRAYWLRWGFMNFSPWLALTLDPPELCLSSVLGLQMWATTPRDRFELRASHLFSHLLGRHPTSWATPPALSLFFFFSLFVLHLFSMTL
jgi:hypothetical protein